MTEERIMQSPLRNTLTKEDLLYFENLDLFAQYLKGNGIKGLWEYMSFFSKDIEKRKIAVIEFIMLYKKSIRKAINN